MRPLFVLCTLLLLNSCVQSQNKKEKKSTNEINFSQAWIWEYENTVFDVDEVGRKGQMWAYYHPQLNYWLFTSESYGASGEMFNWILAKPDGTYIFDYTDEHGKSGRMEMKETFDYIKKLPEYYESNGKTKWYNDDNLGYAKVKGRGYEVKYEWVNDQSEFYFTPYEKVNFLPVYYFNRLNSDVKLPIQFPIDLPSNYAFLEEITQMPQGQVKVELKFISSTEYYIRL